ncbi:retrovirus-related pol polyprotein from transposon TNT 1-94 [Tanacetum coccineum]
MWIDVMKEELKSTDQKKVWDLVNLLEGSERVGCKLVFKTKQNSKGNVERYKARLVAKGYTQKNYVDYNETFLPVSKKDSLRIILELVAHFDLELHQMDVKTAFLNGNLEEEVYMEQPKGFFIDETKGHVSKNFEMKDMAEASYVTRISIFHDVSKEGAARWLANLPRPVGHSSHVAMHASMHSRLLPLLPLLAQACDSGHAATVAAAR